MHGGYKNLCILRDLGRKKTAVLTNSLAKIRGALWLDVIQLFA